MEYPGMENQAAENAAKIKITNRRDAQTETTRRGEVSFYVDMSANTVLQQSQMHGYDRTTKPVGMVEADPERWESVGGRAANDAIAARHLGIQGNN